MERVDKSIVLSTQTLAWCDLAMILNKPYVMKKDFSCAIDHARIISLLRFGAHCVQIIFLCDCVSKEKEKGQQIVTSCKPDKSDCADTRGSLMELKKQLEDLLLDEEKISYQAKGNVLTITYSI